MQALIKLENNTGVFTYNIGSGRGHSVLDMIKSFEKASGRKIAFELAERRPGDVDMCYADSSLAEKELDWKAECSIDKMCADEWRWQKLNPNGYE